MKPYLTLICAIFILCSFILCGGAASVSAQELAIFDCNNVLRAKRSVDPGVQNEVKVDAVDQAGQPANQGNLTLTNVETGEVVTASVESGGATFASVGPGTWVVSSSSSQILVTSFSIVNGLSMLGATAALVGGGAVIAGGGTGLVVAADEIASDDSNDEPDPTPTPVSSPVPTSTPLPPRPQPTPQATPCPSCDPDEDAEEIDDFFGSPGQPVSNFR